MVPALIFMKHYWETILVFVMEEGYEFLCTQHRSTTRLEILHLRPAAGYNVLHLKEAIASTKIYVRPLQKDLNLEPLPEKQVPQVSF